MSDMQSLSDEALAIRDRIKDKAPEEADRILAIRDRINELARDGGTQHTTSSDFGERVIAAREAMGLSQSALAKAAGVTYQAVRKIERGVTTRPQPTTIEKLARVLGPDIESHA